MSDIGPAWLRKELPYPLALSWQLATQHDALDGLQVAGVVETALRVVTALQAAALVAASQEFPPIFFQFERPTLGSWKKLALDLRDCLGKGSSPPRGALAPLATWPPLGTERDLETIVRRRNTLAHDHLMSLSKRSELTAELATHAVSVLESLAWLRDVDLCVFTGGVNHGQNRWLGREQIFRGTEAHPATTRIAWQGDVKIDHTYARVRDADHHILLDIEPFLAHERLGDARLETLCVWHGVGKRGDVRLRDDPTGDHDYRPIERHPRISKIKIYATPTTDTSLTRHELGPRDDAPTHLGQEAPRLKASRATTRLPQNKRGLVWAAIGVGVAAIAAVILHVVTRDDVSPMSPAQTDVAPINTTSTACAPPDIGHAWEFSTIVLGTKPSMKFGLNVKGHYRTVITRHGCSLVADLEKGGWTQSGREWQRRQEGRSMLEVSSSGRSAVASFALAATPDDATPARIALRLARHGPYLIGVWRHEGDDFERSGYWGTAFGLLEGRKGMLPKTSCFETCGRYCFAGRDPHDEQTEDCLVSCGLQLADCE